MKKSFIVFIITLCAVCIYPSIAWSNSPPLIMKGDTAFPISSPSIKLESEVIKIHYGVSKKHGALGHEVEVIFNFHNTGFETDLDIGFPNVASYAEKLRDFEAYDYPSMTPYVTEIKEGGTLPEHDLYYYNSMYAWKMHFEEDERKSLYVKYKFESQQWGADYILVTGALWKDRIDKIDVFVDFPEPAAFAQVTASPSNYYYNGEGIEWHFENIEPDFNLFVGLVDFPEFYEMKEEYFKPRWNDSTDTYRWDDCFYYIDLSVSYGDIGGGSLHDYKNIDADNGINYIRDRVNQLKDTNQFVINEIYARHGYDFKLKEWENIFEYVHWYKHDPQFAPDVFNSMEHATIAYIKCFDKTIITDGSDSELRESLKEFQDKYNGEILFNHTGMLYPYYQYTYELVSSEKERIKGIDIINGHLFAKDNKGSVKKDKVHTQDTTDPSKGILVKKTIKTPDGRKLELLEDGIFISDENGARCIFEYQTFYRKKENDNQSQGIKALQSYPQIKDDIMISPNGNYVLAGTNYELEEITNLVENSAYVISVDEGFAFKLGYGDFEDFLVWWSPSEDFICWQDAKKEPYKLKLYNKLSNRLSEIDLPKEETIIVKEVFSSSERMLINQISAGIVDLRILDDGKVIFQVKNNVYYYNSETGETKSVIGTLTEVKTDGIYYYNGSDIFKANFDEFLPVRVNSLEVSIWKSKVAEENLHFYYGGVSNLFVFNTADTRIYWFTVDDHEAIIKPSPDGNRLYIYKDYFNPFGGERVKGAFLLVYPYKEQVAVVGADETAKWLANDRLLINIYDETNRAHKKHILSYVYDVVNNERHMVKSTIDSFTSQVVNELQTGFGTMTYEYRKYYSDLKRELKEIVFTTSDNTSVYTDNRLLYTRDDVLNKGSLVGILDKGSEASKVCFFTQDNVLYSGWIKNSDFTTAASGIKPTQGFIYNTRVYEFEGEEPKAVLESCSSQVKILKSKPGWLYINAVDRIFGWVREEDVKFDSFFK